MRPESSTRASVAIRSAVVLAVGVVVSAGLAGCVGPAVDPMPGPTTSAPPSATASATATATGTPTPTPTAAPSTPTPIASSCEELVPLQALYDVDPNLALLTDAAPTSALAVDAVAAGGVACTLVHTSTGATIELAVASPGATALAAARQSAGDPIDLGIPGVDGFSSGAGVQAFSGALHYSAESADNGTDVLSVLIAIPIRVLG